MTLTELALEKILESTEITLGQLFPLLFENDVVFPSWIYQRVTMWWLRYNKDSIFDRMPERAIGDCLAQLERYQRIWNVSQGYYSLMELVSMDIPRKDKILINTILLCRGMTGVLILPPPGVVNRQKTNIVAIR